MSEEVKPLAFKTSHIPVYTGKNSKSVSHWHVHPTEEGQSRAVLLVTRFIVLRR